VPAAGCFLAGKLCAWQRLLSEQAPREDESDKRN
jgi:hypothetical protein